MTPKLGASSFNNRLRSGTPALPSAFLPQTGPHQWCFLLDQFPRPTSATLGCVEEAAVTTQPRCGPCVGLLPGVLRSNDHAITSRALRPTWRAHSYHDQASCTLRGLFVRGDGHPRA